MNIYLRELKAHVKSLIVWSITMIFLIAAGMMKYSAFAKTGESINELFKSMPAGLMEVFGIGEGLDLSSIGVFYSIFFLYFMLLTTVHSCLLGTTIIAKEERDKTADFLFVKPIKRHQAVTAKIVAALTMVLIYNLVTGIASMIFVSALNQSGNSLNEPILYISFALLIIQVLYLGIGLLLGAWVKNAAKAASLASAFILGTFLIKVLIDLQDDLDYLEFLTPYRYFESLKVMYDHEMAVQYIVLAGAIIVATIAGTYYAFQRRDLKS